jgi:hypothetical protein
MHYIKGMVNQQYNIILPLSSNRKDTQKAKMMESLQVVATWWMSRVNLASLCLAISNGGKPTTDSYEDLGT